MHLPEFDKYCWCSEGHRKHHRTNLSSPCWDQQIHTSNFLFHFCWYAAKGQFPHFLCLAAVCPAASLPWDSTGLNTSYKTSLDAGYNILALKTLWKGNQYQHQKAVSRLWKQWASSSHKTALGTCMLGVSLCLSAAAWAYPCFGQHLMEPEHKRVSYLNLQGPKTPAEKVREEWDITTDTPQQRRETCSCWAEGEVLIQQLSKVCSEMAQQASLQPCPAWTALHTLQFPQEFQELLCPRGCPGVQGDDTTPFCTCDTLWGPCPPPVLPFTLSWAVGNRGRWGTLQRSPVVSALLHTWCPELSAAHWPCPRLLFWVGWGVSPAPPSWPEQHSVSQPLCRILTGALWLLSLDTLTQEH